MKYKRQYIPKSVKREALAKFDGRCAYCGGSDTNMQIDHMQPIPSHTSSFYAAWMEDKLNWHLKFPHLTPEKVIEKNIEYEKDYEEYCKINALPNLVPACKICNHYKRDRTIDEFRKLIVNLHNNRTIKYLLLVCAKFGISTEIKPFDGIFYFERIAMKEDPNQITIDDVLENK